MKKKLLALVLAAGMVASMAACGNTNSSGQRYFGGRYHRFRANGLSG